MPTNKEQEANLFQIAYKVHQPFWPAEDYHQQYYDKYQKLPYCHRPEPRFD